MPSAATTLFRAFWNLCIFRIGPQDIPASSALLLATCVVNLGLSTFINQIQLPLVSATLVAILELVVLAGLTTAILFYVSHMQRLVQTLTSLMGSGALIGSVVLVLLLVSNELPNFIRLGIFLWNLLVMAHILRSALGVHFVAAFFIAIGYAIFLIQLIVFVGRNLGASVT